MSLRVFTFCDVCNPQGIRTVKEQGHFDRRNSDGRSWYEGKHSDAVKEGWKILDEDKIACPNCAKRGMTSLVISHLQDRKTSEFLKEV